MRPGLSRIRRSSSAALDLPGMNGLVFFNVFFFFGGGGVRGFFLGVGVYGFRGFGFRGLGVWVVGSGPVKVCGL